MDTTPDKTIVTLMKGIKTHESSGNYTQAPETAGTSLGGAYMYQKPTWQQYAKDTLGDSNLPFTPENQDKVTYYKIKQWKDQGLNPEQIIAKWNPGAGQSYVDMVKKAVVGNTNNKSTTQNTPMPQSATTTPQEQDKSTPGYSSGQHSPERIAQYQDEQKIYDKEAKNANSTSGILGNTIKGVGDNLTFGGATQLGSELGTGYAKDYNKLKGLVGSQDNSKYIPDMSLGKTTAGLAKTAAGVLSTAGGAGELKGLIKGGSSFLEAPVVKDLIDSPRIKMTMSQFRALPIDEQYNNLYQVTKGASEYTKAKMIPIFKQMLEEAPNLQSKIVPGIFNLLKTSGKGLLDLAKWGGAVELLRGGQDVKGLLGLNDLTR